MPGKRKYWLIIGVLLLAAAGFRIAVAHWLPNDAPDDGRVYAQMARNVLEQHVYSHEAQSPYSPSLIRVPGYPLFLATIYSIFGHTNNGAARIVQALIDTGTCALVAVLAFLWQPDERRKITTAIAALAFAAVNPFTTIYTATILAEVPAIFLGVASCVAATLALKAVRFERQVQWWAITGALAGLGVMFRPDNGLFAVAIGLMLLVKLIRKIREQWQSHLVSGAVFALAFLLVLAPWTIRNWRVFHLFQPLAPFRANMPDEFVPLGYERWLKTWIENQDYVEAWWDLDTQQITLDDLPDSAFDSAAERERAARLLDQYNGNDSSKNEANRTMPQPATSPIKLDPKTNTNATKQLPGNANNAESNDEDEDEAEPTDEQPQKPAGMTPEIDAAFGQLANERIARHPFRYYVLLPAKRAHALWFNTHSDYYPFAGDLLPFDNPDNSPGQKFWLAVFAGLIGIYTLLGVAGTVLLWMVKRGDALWWVLLVGLIVITRLALASTQVSVESRYVVAFFPFLSSLAGIAVVTLSDRLKPPAESAKG